MSQPPDNAQQQPPPGPAYGYPGPPPPPLAPPQAPARARGPLYAAMAACVASAVIAGTVGYAIGSTTSGSSTVSASPETTPTPTITPVGTAAATYSTSPAPATTTAPTPTPTPATPACTDFAELTDREFKLLGKDPGAHFGKCYRVYGYVTQADSATGAGSFRANACGEKHQPKYGYIADCDTNSIFTDISANGASGIKDIVDGDAFEADVMVGKPFTYTTTLGGQMTAPTFAVLRVKQYATTK
ncbi:hypothetical protein [Streptomyces sp. NBC_01294]|uniref:hypothetical protein n=1 Tax=Streptomyces sp. NBC_01294 TaxID=2903815 RepID=UPI002DDBAC0D|nr:hypothetical protein [Streptomyces sp. NBC_01294]WRZ55519.1 hypothetical protein OG534_02880 [Streptomyces sp. NBC_01294]WRZ61179.1 hypothetical protein OG534_34620 [Streptomyces sp. NBC_01294]